MSSSLSGVFIKLARTLAFALASEVLGVAARGETCVLPAVTSTSAELSSFFAIRNWPGEGSG